MRLALMRVVVFPVSRPRVARRGESSPSDLRARNGNPSSLPRLLGRVLRRRLDLAAQVVQRLLQLHVLVVALRAGLVGALDDLAVALVLEQVLALLARQLDLVALVRADAPVLVV